MTIKAQVDTRPVAPVVPLAPRTLAVLAAACLLIDNARRYGLITGGINVNRGRCTMLLERFAAEGIIPNPEHVEAKALALLVELGELRP